MGRARQIASAENMDRILLDASAASTDEGEHLLLDASAASTDVGFFINTEVGTTETPPEGFVIESSLASNAVTNSKIASDAVTVTELDSSAQTLSNRNLVINGGMKVSQRSTSAITLGNNAFTYTLDRMGFYKSNAGTQTVEQDTDAPVGFDNSLLVKNTSADSSIASTDRLAFIYRVEGLDAAKLEFGSANAKTITISWYVKSTITGTFGGAVGNGSDNRAYPFLYTINSTDWERKSVTIPGDTEGTWATTSARSLQVALGLGVGSTNSGTAGAWESADRNSATGATTDWLTTVDSEWALTGLQIEIGSEATEFEQELFERTLTKCQRYYQRIETNDGAPNYNGLVNAAAGSVIVVPFIHQMRVPPTGITVTNVGSWGHVIYSDANVAANSILFGQASSKQIQLDVNSASGSFSVGEAISLYDAGADGVIEFTGAEL